MKLFAHASTVPLSRTLGRGDLFAFLQFALLVVAVGFVAWSAPRGLDITDEGMYLLISRYPEDVEASLSSAHVYTAALFRLAQFDIARFRLLGLLLTLLAGGWFALGLLRLFAAIPILRMAAQQRLIVVSFCLIGATLLYGWTLRTPSYNTLTSFAVTVFAGCFLLALPMADSVRSRRTLWCHLALAGMAVGLCFFSKFPPAVILWSGGIVLLALWPGLKQRWLAIALLISGSLLWALIHFLLFERFDTWLHSWRAGFAAWSMLDTAYGESPARKSIREAFELFRGAAWKYRGILSILLVLTLASLSARFRAWLHGWSLNLILGALGLGFLIQSVNGDFFLGGDDYFRVIMRFYAGAALILCAAIGLSASMARAIALSDSERTATYVQLGLALAFLTALPIVAAAGTGNPLHLNTLLTMAPWFGMLAGLLAILAALARSQLIMQTGTLIVSVFACSQIVSGYFVSPYRWHDNVLRQSVPVNIGDPESQLRLDRDTAAFFDAIQRGAAAGGLRSGDDVLALFNMPGVVYAIGARSPMVPWYHAGYRGARQMNEFILAQIPHARLARAYILHKSGNPESFPDLRRAGLAFPEAYTLIADATWPVTGQRVQLWKPRAAVTP